MTKKKIFLYTTFTILVMSALFVMDALKSSIPAVTSLPRTTQIPEVNYGVLNTTHPKSEIRESFLLL